MKKCCLYVSAIPVIIAITGIFLLSGCKKKPDLPTLSTTAISGITVNSASSGGNISSDGGAEVTIRGLCWNTSKDPVVTGSHTTDGTGTGAFVSSITGLSPNTSYYVRAYATNSVGTAYGNEVNFTTSPVVLATLTTSAVTSINPSSAVCGGSISADGGGPVTAKGVCWSTSANPTTADNKTTDGTGTESFVSNITGLQPGTTYHVRAYATNSAGTAYGNDITFTSSTNTPTLTTTAATSVTSNSAASGGNITADGGAPISSRGICWKTSTNPMITDSHTSDGTGSGSFTSNMTGLQPNTRYYVRAYATNSAGTAYGNEIVFDTNPIVIPTVTTTAASSMTLTTAVSGGNVTSSGGASVTARGVCWSTSANPTIAGSRTNNGTGTGPFTSNLTDLQPGTTYHIRAYATNSAGTGYGDDLTFTTQATIPTLSTTAASSFTTTSAASGGNITSNGGAAITARGVCWGTSASPTVAGSHSNDGTGNGLFTSSITGLTPGTVYYARAYATNSVGTAYGLQIEFCTSIADVEGNIYRIVKIGNQLWMSENLRTTKYTDNSDIPYVTDAEEWSGLTTPAYCWYANNISYRTPHGALYNWITVTTNRLCPAGWHVPTDDEFNTMELYLGIPANDINTWGWRGTNEGSEMKSTSGWGTGENGTNTSGFTALPGGYRYAADGLYYSLGTLAYWWTASLADTDIAWYRRLDGPNTDVYKGATSIRGGKFIRCVKN